MGSPNSTAKIQSLGQGQVEEHCRVTWKHLKNAPRRDTAPKPGRSVTAHSARWHQLTCVGGNARHKGALRVVINMSLVTMRNHGFCVLRSNFLYFANVLE